MRFGIALESFTPPGKNPSPDSIFESAHLAESLGFDSAWVWDHVLLGSKKVFPVLDSLTTLSYVGARTKTLKLGTSVLIIPLRNPVILAKQALTIQYFTGGRLLLGVAPGWYKREFDATGSDFSKRGRIFEKNFNLMRRLFSENDVNQDGDGYVLSHASMEPKSDKPIPMLSGGYSDFVLRRAGRLADGWVGYYFPPEEFRRSWELVKESAVASKRNPDELRPVNIVPLAIEKNLKEGDDVLEKFTKEYMDLPKDTPCSTASGVRGTVDDCIDQIRAYEKSGVKDIVFIPCFYKTKYIELAGRELLPRFRNQ